MIGYILIYLGIFIAKIIEVSLMTLRVMLITRGEKLIGSIVGFFEVSLWIVIAGKVLNDIQSDPIKAVIYALGFACGNYIGTIIEERLAIGISSIQAIVSKENSKDLSDLLRDNEFGVTIVSAEGKDEKRTILMIYSKRKRLKEAIQLIQDNTTNAVISVNDTKAIYGAYGLIRK